MCLLSSHLSSQAESLYTLIQNAVPIECHIITCISQESHISELDADSSLVGRWSQQGDEAFEWTYFQTIEARLHQWMNSSLVDYGNPQSRLIVSVRYEPLCLSIVFPSLFLLPGSVNLFPTVHSMSFLTKLVKHRQQLVKLPQMLMLEHLHIL